MSIKKTVLALFSNFPPAARAVRAVDTKRLANSEISLLVKNPSLFREEAGEELFPSDNLHGVLVDGNTFNLPEIGPVQAWGPLAGFLQKHPENGISRALINYGLTESKAGFFARSVINGQTLVLCETNNDKANHLANILEENGGNFVEKWNKHVSRPEYPHH